MGKGKIIQQKLLWQLGSHLENKKVEAKLSPSTDLNSGYFKDLNFELYTPEVLKENMGLKKKYSPSGEDLIMK